MRPHHSPVRLARPATLLFIALAALAGAPEAAAQTPPSGGMGGTTGVPPADKFAILYYITDEKGNRVRRFAQRDFDQYLNKARCECGQKISADIRLQPTSGMSYNLSTRADTFVGTMCSTAEVAPVGQFRRCAKLISEPLPQYQYGIPISFHPVWLVNGVALASGMDRDPDTALAAGSCDGVAGESGIWMCVLSNNTPDCQTDEFIVTGLQNYNLPSRMGGIKYDFIPPQTIPEKLTAQPGDGAIVLNWTLKNPGDIYGYRVLCEDAETKGPVEGKEQPAPTLTGPPLGTSFFTKEMVCPNGPFSTYLSGNDNPLDPTATDTDGGTGSGTDATGGTTGVGTTGVGTTGADTGGDSFVCGDETVDPDEECDLGMGNNSDDGACRSDCTLNRCGDGVLWAMGGEECDDGNDVNGDACTNECKNAICGDGIYQSGVEECDMGSIDTGGQNGVPGSPCGENCTILQCEADDDPLTLCMATCGNGVVDDGEGCDSGSLNSDHGSCTVNCQTTSCGDSLIMSDPEDDGMTVPEECDDGMNNGETAPCTPDCLKNDCGDGYLLDGVETCDDGTDNGWDKACLPNCQPARCGDGEVQAGVEDCDLGLDNGDGSTCSTECKFTISEGLRTLDWDYVCTGHLQALTTTVRITGLENGKTYNFRLVPYDIFGNPLLMDTIVQGTPIETYDLWEQCEADGGICGQSGYCNVSVDTDGLAVFSAIAALGLGGLGVRRRRKKVA